jgi:uncharacterized protein YjbI with pentapeptide repeats
MTTDARIMLAFLGFTMAGAARAGDAGFRVNPETGLCENGGQQGHNPEFVGECGDLTRAFLYGADLRGRNLKGALFSRTSLAHADLRGADLRGATFDGAYMYRADLSGADLRDAVFVTRLHGAEFTNVLLDGAIVDACTVLPFSRDTALARRMVVVDHQTALAN